MEEVLNLNDFELDNDNDGLFLADNAPLFMKLRESERNRRSKMREAAKNAPPVVTSSKAAEERDLTYSEGFFGPGLLNPFSSSHHDREINEDFLMKDFENLLKRKPQDVHKRPKLSPGPPHVVSHLNLSSTKPFTALYDRFDDFDDPTYLINQVYYTDNDADINDYHSEVTRGRQTWLQEAYRDFLPSRQQQRRTTPLINNLFTESAEEKESGKETSGLFLAAKEDSEAQSGPKLYLLKLIEFNKIEVVEKYGFAAATVSQGDMFDDE